VLRYITCIQLNMDIENINVFLHWRFFSSLNLLFSPPGDLRVDRSTASRHHGFVGRGLLERGEHDRPDAAGAHGQETQDKPALRKQSQRCHHQEEKSGASSGKTEKINTVKPAYNGHPWDP
jgi:hypothetical protein